MVEVLLRFDEVRLWISGHREAPPGSSQSVLALPIAKNEIVTKLDCELRI